MTWPYDPAIYAYLLNAAAAASLHTHHYHHQHQQQQSYTFPPSPAALHRLPPSILTSPFAYYASIGLQRVAAAAYGSQPPPTNIELFAKSSSTDNTSLGPSTSPHSPIEPPTLIPHSTSSQGHGVTGLCACAACCPVISGLQQTATIGSVSTGLFQPYKSDIERSP